MHGYWVAVFLGTLFLISGIDTLKNNKVTLHFRRGPHFVWLLSKRYSLLYFFLMAVSFLLLAIPVLYLTLRGLPVENEVTVICIAIGAILGFGTLAVCGYAQFILSIVRANNKHST